MMSQQRLWNQLEGFTHQIHGSLDLKETAYAVVNDGKRLVGCDRLSVALKIGGRIMVEAVSGQEIVEQRSNLVRELTRLCKVVIRSGEDLVYTGNTEGFAPDIRDALEIYVDESGSKVVVVTLLHKPEHEEGRPSTRRRCRSAASSPSRSATRWPRPTCTPGPRSSRGTPRRRSGMRRNTTRSSCARCSRRWALPGGCSGAGRWPRSPRVLAAILAVIGVLTFVPWTLTIEGRGSLLPEERRTIYAPIAGIVVDVPVEHGELVKKGDMHRPARQQGAPEGAEEADRRSRQGADPGELSPRSRIRRPVEHAGRPKTCSTRSRLSSPRPRSPPRARKEQIEIIQEQIELDDHPSPAQDGIITTWEVKKNLMGRPVEIGHELLERSPPSAVIPTGCSRSRFPTTTWARCSRPRASSRRRSPRARSSPARHSRPTS